MIIISWNEEQERAEVQFNGSAFQEVLALCKNSYLSWDKENKIFYGSHTRLLGLADQFKLEDPNTVVDPKLYQIPEPALETKFARVPVPQEIFRKPPIVGKPGYENYQSDSVIKGIRQNRLYLAPDPGLGKTYIMTCIMNYLDMNNKVDKYLIIAPVEGLYNFMVECKKYYHRHLDDSNFYIADTSNRTPFNSQARFIIMSYRTFLMLMDDAYFIKHKKKSKEYRNCPIDLSNWGEDGKRCIILDEAHNIKNPQARQTKAILLIKEYFTYRYALSGTPNPNGFQDIYSQMKFLDSGLVPKDFQDFILDIALIGNKFSKTAIREYKPKRVAFYEKKFDNHIIRLKSEDVLDLPPLVYDNIYCKLSGKHEDIYRGFTDYVLKLHVNKYGKLEPSMIRNSLSYITLALHNPVLLHDIISETDENGEYSEFSAKFSKVINSFKFEEHNKLPELDSLVERYIVDGSTKFLIMDYHPKNLDALAERYKKFNPLVVHGELAYEDRARERSEIFNTFQTSPSRNLLLASQWVMSTSITINACSKAAYMSRDWNFLTNAQSIKRIHRIGTTERVIAHPLIFMNTIEQTQDAVLLDKKLLNDVLFKHDALSREQWKKIFNGNVEDLV